MSQLTLNCTTIFLNLSIIKQFTDINDHIVDVFVQDNGKPFVGQILPLIRKFYIQIPIFDEIIIGDDIESIENLQQLELLFNELVINKLLIHQIFGDKIYLNMKDTIFSYNELKQIIIHLMKSDPKQRIISLNKKIFPTIEPKLSIPDWFVENDKFKMVTAAGDEYGSYKLKKNKTFGTNVSYLSSTKDYNIFICLPENLKGCISNILSILVNNLDVLLIFMDVITTDHTIIDNLLRLFRHRIESINYDDKRYQLNGNIQRELIKNL